MKREGKGDILVISKYGRLAFRVLTLFGIGVCTESSIILIGYSTFS